MAALKDNLLKYGVLRTRDLVELYYGWRLVGQALPAAVLTVQPGAPIQVLAPDPRRYRYLVSFTPNGSASSIWLGTSADVAVNNGFKISTGNGVSITYERNFRVHLDTTCDALWAVPDAIELTVTVLAFVLQAAPVDEVPLA